MLRSGLSSRPMRGPRSLTGSTTCTRQLPAALEPSQCHGGPELKNYPSSVMTWTRASRPASSGRVGVPVSMRYGPRSQVADAGATVVVAVGAVRADGVVEDGAPQVGAVEARVAEVGIRQVGAAQVGIDE